MVPNYVIGRLRRFTTESRQRLKAVSRCKNHFINKTMPAISTTRLSLIITLILVNFIPARSGERTSKINLQGNPVDIWSFDDGLNNEWDSFQGKYEFVPGIKGNALKLDGFRTFVKTSVSDQKDIADGFTVESWISLARYPWSWSPVIDCTGDGTKGFFFGIDHMGHVGIRVAAGNAWHEVSSEKSIPLREWVHIAAVFRANEQITLYIDQQEVGSVNIEGAFTYLEKGSNATIGRNNNLQLWEEPQLTNNGTYFFLDGLLDEISISAEVKFGNEIGESLSMVRKSSAATILSERGKFPKGPAGPGTFGAFYTRLDYYKEWDDMWRVSDMPDVFVRFDNSPVQLIFWRGNSFVPCWVSENDIWYTNEWLETWGSDVQSCAEPIMDRHGRYAHVRIVEANDARVVIHWRYALADAFYDFAAVSDDGRGEWCDEYHTIYPDQVGIRKMELHYSKPERKHDWVEQIVLTQPGKYPYDLIEKNSITLVNMQGDVRDYTWDENLKVEMPEPKQANISYVNLKSEYKPFFIISPGAVNTVEGKWGSPFFRTYAANQASKKYRPDSVPSAYGWWNHWPVAQIPGDGRWVETPDKPGHFNLTTFVQWQDYSKTDKTRTRIMLQGMTNKEAVDLVPLAKSWLNAPELMISTDGYQGGKYDESERAYILEKVDHSNTSPLQFVINGSAESPIIHPAFIIKNSNRGKSRVIVNNKTLNRNQVKQGIRTTSESEDLIVWLKMESRENIQITLE